MNLRKLIYSLLKNQEYKVVSEKVIELKKHLHSPKSINNEKLQNFIDFAIANSTYYKKLGAKEIHEFPILTKEILKRNFEDIITVDKEEVENYPFVTTSGSYGTPFKFYVNKEKRLTQQAEIVFFGRWSNFDIGTKHLNSRVIEPSIITKITKNQYFLKPEKIDKDWIINSIAYIQRIKPKVIVSYPSTLDNMAIFMKSYKIKLKDIEGIITYGENLSDEARKNIEQTFGVEPYSRYSTWELGVLGNNFGEGTKMLINQVNFLVEILNEDNLPVKQGEIGKVVVTDFTSKVTPLIRYDTGDLARVREYKDGLVYQIDNLEGRKIEVINNTNDEPVSPFIINSIMRSYQNLLQFQFIQHTESDYELKVLPMDTNSNETYETALMELQSLLGKDSNINLNIVSEIETLKSGKRPHIINQYERNKNNG